MNPLRKIPDCFAASVPLVANITLEQINTLVGIVGGLLGIAYLIWKWRRDADK